MARSRVKPLRRSPIRAFVKKQKRSPFRGGWGDFMGSDIGQTMMRGDVLNLTGWKDFTKKEEDESQGKISDAFKKFQGLGDDASKNLAEGINMKTRDVKNAFAGLGTDFKNTFKDIKNPYAEIDETNFAEDLTVNTQAANFEKEMAQQSQANVMQGMAGAAGGSGIAGLAQAMANQGAQTARRIAGGLGQQESQVQMARMAGKQDVQRRRELQMRGGMEAEMAKATGAQTQQQMIADREMGIASGQQQANMANAQAYNAQQQAMAQMQFQGASDSRKAQIELTQGELSFLSGEKQAAEQNAIADKTWTERTFSDRKLKQNITLIKKSPNGLNVYNFEYKDSKFGDGIYQGVMSDEIPQEAVIKHSNGYDMVDYNKIDVDFIKIKD